MEPVFLSDLDAEARREWAERLDTGCDAYVVEEFLPLSHAPAWHDGRLESRALMLRVFLLADGHGDYRVMPGGLSRIAGEDRQVVSGQRGGSSKDTWVLSDEAVAPAVPVERRARMREASRRAPDVEPCGGAPVLAGAIRGAEREQRQAAPLGARPPDRRRRRTGRAPSGVPARVRPSWPARQAVHDPHRVRDRARPDCRAGRSSGRAAAWASTSSRRSASRARCATACPPTTGASSTACCSCSCAHSRAPDLDDALELDRRRAGVARGGRRPRDGAHDPRRRLAVLEPWPSPRTAALRLEHARRRRAGARLGRIRRCSSGCSSCRTAC